MFQNDSDTAWSRLGGPVFRFGSPCLGLSWAGGGGRERETPKEQQVSEGLSDFSGGDDKRGSCNLFFSR